VDHSTRSFDLLAPPFGSSIDILQQRNAMSKLLYRE
jgi:hypothetical protein